MGHICLAHGKLVVIHCANKTNSSIALRAAVRKHALPNGQRPATYTRRCMHIIVLCLPRLPAVQKSLDSRHSRIILSNFGLQGTSTTAFVSSSNFLHCVMELQGWIALHSYSFFDVLVQGSKLRRQRQSRIFAMSEVESQNRDSHSLLHFLVQLGQLWRRRQAAVKYLLPAAPAHWVRTSAARNGCASR